MPVTIPAGTKFEAIKPTTNVNRRSALVNANDLTYTIEDIAAAAGGGTPTFPISNNRFPKANSSGNLVGSALSEFNGAIGFGIAGSYEDGIWFDGGGANLISISNDPAGQFANIGDTNGNNGPAWGIYMDGTAFPYIIISANNISHLSFTPFNGSYQIGGSTTRFGIKNGDLPQSSLLVSPDLVTNVAGTNYIKVDVGGVVYKIALVP